MTLALDWDAYKRLCDTPAVISRWMLEQTAELLEESLCAALESAMRHAPLAKPADHKGDAGTDMFQLGLEREQVLAVHARVAAAVQAGETTSGTRSRGLGGFEEAWREYAESLRQTGVF